ncbi:long-chain fatty acid transporter [Alteromonas sp. 345S023]|uniref:Long-chain fatty acid transporter n=1 Tax=Alteromonas profundi TaxID=2696062 RepID=A0A7X5LNE0_9ALTE|nr:outer membrane protein transport protein [Alteromonas profundi]NDV92587.1 long-chain fatty acid transporter [Alteromonas profundi]
MKQYFSLRVAVGVALATVSSSSALAAGFQVNEHSANGLGRAMAGQAAMPENASVLATNPAAIGVFTTSQFSGSVSSIFPSVDVTGQITSTMPTEAGDVVIASEDASEDDIADIAIIPSFFYVTPLNEKWSVGVGAFSTYGLRSDYGDDFEALHFADTAEVESFTINPAVSYKVNDTLRVGFGLNITYADAEISSALPNSLTTVLGVPTANASVFKLEGDDIGYGWNAGVFYQPTSSTNIALSYRAETKLELDGEVSSALSAELNQPGSLDLNLASITELAISQELDEQWSVQASLVFTDWSTFQKLEANLASGDDFLIKEENFDDSLRGSIGVTYVLNDEYTLRAGYAYDDGVVTVENRSLSIPDTDRHWITGGVTYSMTEATTIDLAYAYINGREASINKTRSLGSTGISSTMVGSQSATAHVLSVQVNTRF